jgi:uncharacterized protein
MVFAHSAAGKNMVKGIQECRDNALNFLQKNDFDVRKTLSRGFVNVSLLLTHKCNLSCPYCYQAKSFKAEDGVMSRETADKAFKFIYSEFGDIEVTVSLFGGEPFLNFELIKYLVEKYQQVRFVVTTNGRILAEDEVVRDWVSKQANLTVSFSFNALKPLYNGTLLDRAKVIFDLLKLTRGEVHYVIDTPFDPDILKNIRFMLECNVPQIRVNLPKETKIIEDHKEEYISLFKKIADLIYKGDSRPPKFGWDNAFQSNACRQVKGKALRSTASSYCGAGFNYLAINSKGEIFPCDYFAAFPEFIIGNIETGFKNERRVFQDLEDWYKKIYSHCQDCPLGDIRLCPNPMCYAENYKVNKNILMPTKNACVLREIEYAIYTYVSEIGTEPREDIDASRFVI